MLWNLQRMSLLLAGFALRRVSSSIPQPSNSGFEIIFPNDLLGPQSQSTKAVLLLDSALSQEAAALACAALHESLVDPDDYIYPFTLGYMLSQTVQITSQSLIQRYWISSSGSSCRVIDPAGVATTVSCNQQLPFLCTQSAPFSNSTYADNSVDWQIEVQSGSQAITGYRDRATFRFLGVRYAEQPERFTYSQIFDGPGSQSAIAFGSECTQAYNLGGTEDCLFLNIFTAYVPKANTTSPASQLKPVMFYIHGGGFIVGAGSASEYDGGNLASRGDVVVVTINYRLGAFGYLALDDGLTNGNFGLSDQITALDWVMANIASFGGDPAQITIFGQSAGALSVTAFLRSPKAIGKFAAAMPMSNLAGLGIAANYENYPSIATMATLMEPLLAATECTNATSQVECLRAAEASKIGIYGSNAVYMVVDGTYINSSRLILDGSEFVAHVPLLIGNMHDEGAALISYPNATDIAQAITDAGFNASDYTPALFPSPSGPNATLDVFNVTVHFSTDAFIRCFDQAIAYAGSKNNIFKSVWYYEYERSYQPADFEINNPVCNAPVDAEHPYGDTSQPYFKCHGGDVYYVFGNILRSGKQLRDDVDLPFSQFITDSLSAFARTHNPNPTVSYLRTRNYLSTLAQIQSPGGIWQPVTAAADPLRRLAWPSEQAPFNDIAQCKQLGIPLEFLA